MFVTQPSVEMRSKPTETSSLETECLFGEKVIVLDQDFEWLFCELSTDNYRGWLKKNALGHLKTPTHRVYSQRTFLFTNKDLKSTCLNYLPMGALLSIGKIEEEWAETYLSDKNHYQVAYVPSKHIVKIGQKVNDWVTVAEQFIGTPYKWGGRDSIGIDCSALIQLSYQNYGGNIPRNSFDQQKIEKKLVNKFNNLDRGHVVFWNGHVSVMTDKINSLHANAFHMKTLIEPLESIIKRMPSDNQIIKILDFNQI